MAEFHFLRPQWLLLILPAVCLVWLAWREVRGGAGWRSVIDARLLPFLLEGEAGPAWKRHLALLLAGWVIAALALAGPAWQKLPSPLERRLDLQIVLFDLSLSMYAQDIKPSRLERARHKLQDFLQQRREGQTALIAYAGDAFVVTPFTDDQATILNQVRALDPALMPAPGSNLPAALRESERLLQAAAKTRSRLLIITDEIRDGQIDAARAWSRRHDIPLDILAVGTRAGAPIPLPGGDFARDGMGKLVTPGSNLDPMRSLARATGGRFQVIRPDQSDITALLAAEDDWNPATETAQGRQADTYRDTGPWLALLLLPLAALAFRRGILLVLPLVLFLAEPPSAHAFDWQSLWRNPDQRGLQSFQEEKYEAATEQFEDPAWRAAALYRQGRHEEAAQAWRALDAPDAQYNRGNALAQAGDLEGALEAYDHVLAQDPDHADARANRALVEQLLQQQEAQQQQSGQGEEGEQSEQRRQQDQAEQSGDRSGEDRQAEQDAMNENEPAEAGPEPPQPQQADGAQEQTDRDQSESEQAESAQPAEAGDDSSAPQQAQAESPGEHDQALEQWLRRIPDDPSALLRRKFLWQYQQRANRDDGTDDGGADW